MGLRGFGTVGSFGYKNWRRIPQLIFPTTLLNLLLFATRHYPLTRGRDFFFRNFVLGRKVVEQLALLPNPQKSRRGFPVFCNPRDTTSDWIKLWGEHERLTERFLLQALKGGGTFLDLGANVGYFSLLIAHEVGERCQVIAFEPNPPIFELLLAGARASRHAGALLAVPLALSDRAGRLDFVVDPENTGHSHLAAAGEAGGKQSVEVVVLDEWLAANPPRSRITAVKLDVEGCELHALRGMERMLREHRPAIVIEVIEEHLQSFGASTAAVAAFLKTLGYDLENASAADGNLYLPSPHQAGA